MTRAIDIPPEQRAAGREPRFGVNLSGHTIGDERLLELLATDERWWPTVARLRASPG